MPAFLTAMTAAEKPPDPYWKLLPPPATSDDEVCHCKTLGPLLLRDLLGPNPIGCFECNGEVSPDRIGLTPELVEQIANWRSLHSSLYGLWLSSGDYEAWARDQLLDANGEVHRLGYEIVNQLNGIPGVSAYYWFFVDTDSDTSPETCPRCGRQLGQLPNGEIGECEACRIIL